jgi:signal recognition particle GTPase
MIGMTFSEKRIKEKIKKLVRKNTTMYDRNTTKLEILMVEDGLHCNAINNIIKELHREGFLYQIEREEYRTVK